MMILVFQHVHLTGLYIDGHSKDLLYMDQVLRNVSLSQGIKVTI